MFSCVYFTDMICGLIKKPMLCYSHIYCCYHCIDCYTVFISLYDFGLSLSMELRKKEWEELLNISCHCVTWVRRIAPPRHRQKEKLLGWALKALSAFNGEMEAIAEAFMSRPPSDNTW